MSRLLQFVPTLEPGAIGAHTLEVARLCDDLGVTNEIFAEHDRFDGRAIDFRHYGRGFRAAAGDVLLYHVATGSTVADFVRERAEPLLVDHHNITPASYFQAWEPDVVHGIAWGRKQLVELANRATLGLADSDFNRRELDALGYRETTTAPILLDTATFERVLDEAALDRLTHDGTAWLFVGRVAPHKAQHDVLKAFAVYRRLYDPHAVLRLVGPSSSDRYVRALRDTAATLGLVDAVELSGSVSDGELAAHYRSADVFVCLSEHEGFCVPLLESMHHGLPIVAHAATAVPETLDGAGVLLPEKSAATVAAAVHRVCTDAALRDALVTAGQKRVADFSLDVTRRRWQEALAPIVGR